jgi:hypothetical protein
VLGSRDRKMEDKTKLAEAMKKAIEQRNNELRKAMSRRK